jgi:hypothetical protein
MSTVSAKILLRRSLARRTLHYGAGLEVLEVQAAPVAQLGQVSTEDGGHFVACLDCGKEKLHLSDYQHR